MSDVDIDSLRIAVENLHGCRATFREVARVVETFEGQAVWEGEVHVFALEGHTSAERCYAWSHAVNDSKNRRFVAVLHAGLIDSPQAAVRAAIVEEHKRKNAGDGGWA